MPCLRFAVQGIFLILTYYWYNKDMEQDYNEKHWSNPCPKYDCRKNNCKCGLKYINIPSTLEKEYAPVNGAFCNTIVEYESGAVYIYSVEGVPVLIKEGNAS